MPREPADPDHGTGLRDRAMPSHLAARGTRTPPPTRDRAGSRPLLAVFDIDGTLVRGASERQFFRYLARRGRVGLRQVLAYGFFLPRYVAVAGIHTAKKNKAYLSGIPRKDIETLAAAFVADMLAAQLYTPVAERLRRHLEHGDTVLLLSGTLASIARAIGDRLGVMLICATLPNERNGKFTAQPPDVHPFGAAKLNLLAEIAREHGIALGDVTAYANSRHDLPLLLAVGKPVAVRPDTRLRDVARERGWEVIGDDRADRALAEAATPGSRGASH